MQKEITRQIQEMLKHDIIEESSGMLAQYFYPLPRLEDAIDNIAAHGGTIFSSLDIMH